MAAAVVHDVAQNLSSFASPHADAASLIPDIDAVSGVLAKVLAGASVWNVLASLLLAAVVYDQCEFLLAVFENAAIRVEPLLTVMP
jgi:hypothetical protein